MGGGISLNVKIIFPLYILGSHLCGSSCGSSGSLISRKLSHSRGKGMERASPLCGL